MDTNGHALRATRFTNVAAMLAMPIFNAGRTRAINDIAEARQREAVLVYEDAIVRATGRRRELAGRVRQRTEPRRRLEDRSHVRRLGVQPRAVAVRPRPDRPVAAARRAAHGLAVRVSSNDSDTQLLLDSVQLYKALGGGWQVFEPVAANTSKP